MALQKAIKYIEWKFYVNGKYITNILGQITRGKQNFDDIVRDYENKFNTLKDLISVCIEI